MPLAVKQHSLDDQQFADITHRDVQHQYDGKISPFLSSVRQQQLP
ncbi:MAG: hypothetical protein ACK4VP_05970 [Nitrospira sp.]